ncbi:MAG: flippase [Anaerolineales bacterium]|nr:MAG: flippase [Anaerolineales bacterium]
MSERGLGRIIIKNTAFITLGSVVLKALTFLFNVYVVRQLGDDRFGQYSIVLAFAGLFSIFFELGMTQYVMREIAQDRSKAQSLFWNLVALRFLLAILGIIGITLGAVAVGYAPEMVLGIFIHACGFLLYAFLAPLTTVLTANERLDYVTGLTVLGQLIFVLFGAIFLLSGWGFISLIVASLIGVPLQIGLAIWAIRRHHMATLSIQIEPRTWPRLIRSGLPFGIISLALTIAYSIDTVMLSMYQPEHVVGWYNVAYNLVFSLIFFFRGFKEAIVPSLSRTYVNDPTQVERWYHRSVKFIAISSMPIAVGGMLVAFPLIRFLYTDAFLPSALALQILIWDVPLMMFTSFCGNMTTIIGEERAAARIYSINAAANVILNLYAIPRFGLVGASLVTVVTDLIGALQFYFLLRRKLHPPDMIWVFVRILIASVLMGVAVRLADDLNLFLLIGLGAVVYSGLVLGLRLLDDTEWAMILRLLRRRSDSQPTEEAT